MLSLLGVLDGHSHLTRFACLEILPPRRSVFHSVLYVRADTDDDPDLR